MWENVKNIINTAIDTTKKGPVRDSLGDKATIPEWCELKRGGNMELIEITFEEAAEHIENDEEVYFQESKGCTLKRVKKQTKISGEVHVKYFLKGQFYLKRKGANILK